ncbi:MAG: hypothetical protein Q8J84_00290 [Flavobacteriaceae bacterium]|nr:hypothetical protein [Flavobacteriaceae bacterium]
MLFKIALILAAFYTIYNKVFVAQNSISFNLIDNFTTSQLSLIVLLMLILSTLNWLLEFYKWKVLVSSIDQISFFDSMQQCLTAHTAALITPFKMGEFGFKAMFYEPKNLSKILYLNFLGNGSQLLTTIIFGFLGWYFYPNSLQSIAGNSYNSKDQFIMMFLTVIILIFGFGLIRNRFVFWKNIPVSVHFKNIGLALLRFLIFSHQFLFLLYLINPDLDYFNTISAIFSMYFLAALIPTFAILDWAIKGSIAIFLLGILGFQAQEILLISLLMWIFNFALPALSGSYFMFTFTQNKILINE